METLTDTIEARPSATSRTSTTWPAGPGAPDRVDGTHLTNGDFYAGGVVAGIHKGYFRRQIAEASYRFSEECEATTASSWASTSTSTTTRSARSTSS
jgi:hypothetical protein